MGGGTILNLPHLPARFLTHLLPLKKSLPTTSIDSTIFQRVAETRASAPGAKFQQNSLDDVRSVSVDIWWFLLLSKKSKRREWHHVCCLLNFQVFQESLFTNITCIGKKHRFVRSSWNVCLFFTEFIIAKKKKVLSLNTCNIVFYPFSRGQHVPWSVGRKTLAFRTTIKEERASGGKSRLLTAF